MKKSIKYLLIAAIMLLSLPLAALAQIDVSLPETVNGSDGDTVMIPITVGSLTGEGVESYEFTLPFDDAVVNIYNYNVDGTLSEGAYLDVNTAVDGQISVAATPGADMTGSGVLGNLCVELLATGQSDLDLAFQFNEGTPAANVTDGVVSVNYVNVSIPDVSGKIGEEFTFPITVTEPLLAGFASYDFTLKFDESVMKVTGYDAASTLSENMSVSFNDEEGIVDDMIQVSAAQGDNVSEAGVLLNLTVELVGNGDTDITFDPLTFDEGNVGSSANVAECMVSPVKITVNDLGGKLNDTLLLPIEIENITGMDIEAYEFTMDYNETVMNVIGVEDTETLSEGMFFDLNDGDGTVTLAAGGSSVLSGEGTLVYLEIELVGSGNSNVSFSSFMFNEGTPGADYSDVAVVSTDLVDVYLPTVNYYLADTVLIPVTVEEIVGTEAASYTFSFDYNPGFLEVLDVVKENTLSAEMFIEKNLTEGNVTLSAAGDTDIEENGTLINIQAVILAEGTTTLEWSSFTFNEGSPLASLTDGVISLYDRNMTIAEARVDADMDYVPDLLDREVTVTGVVTTPNFATGGTDWAIQDDEAGILVYAYSTPTNAVMGDSVKVTGVVDQYRGKTEIMITDSADVEVLASDATIPAPAVMASLEGVNLEDYESELVTLTGVTVVDGDWPEEGSSGNVDLVVGDDTLTIRVDSDTDIDGWEEHPTSMWTFDLTGIIDQFTYSDPADDGYQIKPRSQDDFSNREINEYPTVAGVVPVSDTKLQIRFTEDVNAVTVDNFTINGEVGVPTAVEMPQADLAILTHGAIEPNTAYSVTVSGVTDLTGVEMVETAVEFRLCDMGEMLPIDDPISEWESDIGNWHAPTWSGSTNGILTSSSFELSDEAAYMGTNSGKLTILDDPETAGGWFIRMGNRVDKIKPDAKIYMYMKGTATDVQIRYTIWDNGAGGDGYEVSKWHDVTLEGDDWQVVCLDLANDPVTGWITGNDAINSTNYVTIESLQLQSKADVDAELYLDMFTERENVMPVEVSMAVDMTYMVNWEQFDPASDFVDVAGSFNDWSGTTLSDEDNDNVWDGVVGDFYPGDSLFYKFRINASWDEDKHEWPNGGPNRVFVVGDTDTTVYHEWHDYDPNAVDPNEELVPSTYALEQNYPNPFNPTTTIKYQLPENAKVRIAIYDVMGNLVRTLVNGEQSTGYQSVIWDARDSRGARVSSGVYIYHMQANDYHQTHKMMLVK